MNHRIPLVRNAPLTVLMVATVETAIGMPDRGASHVSAQALSRSGKALATSPVRAVKR